MGRPKEIEKRKLAFKLYKKYNNLSKVADEVEITHSQICKWKKEDDWDEKLLQYQDLLKTRLTLKQTSETNIMLKEDEAALGYLGTLDDIALEAIYTGEIVPTTWNELISTLRFTSEQRRLILGQPTVRTEKTINIEVQGYSDDELDRRVEETQRAIALLEPRKD